MTKATCVALVVLLLAGAAAVAAEPEPVRFTKPPTVTRDGATTRIRFAVSRQADVEVAILDVKGNVVRHLAAGVLGARNAPPPPLKPGLAQSIVWDAMNDYGEEAKGGPFKVRVRVGMGVKLERIVGGDPYAFYSRQSGQGDHFQWKMAGLEAKADGKVYVMGNTTFYGAQVIRQYDAAGNYVKTVFPPPAGKPAEDVKGWGINVRADGSFTLKNGNSWQSSWMGSAGIAANYGKIVVGLAPTPEQSSLTLLSGPRAGRRCQFIGVGTDGTLKAYKPRPFFGSTKLPKYLRGPFYTVLAPDRKHLYVSGLHSCQRKVGYGRATSVDTTGFWRDGQVWKLDLATRKMSAFFALDEKTVIGDMKTRAKVIGDQNYVNPGAVFHGVAVDPEGRVFVCDRQNQRVAVLDENGKLIRELPVKYPDAIGVSPRSKAVYVTTRYGDYSGRGKLALLKFNDWSKDNAPAVTLPLRGSIGKFPEASMMAVVEHKGQAMVWVAYTTLPVRVYRDTGAGLELVKDFYESGAKQRCLDLQHMQVDQKTEHVYIDDAAGWFFRLTEWENPTFQLCMDSTTKKRIRASSAAIDTRNRYLYAKFHYTGGVRRYKLDGDRIVPATVGASGNKVTGNIMCGWGFSGIRERGMAASPDGGLATLGIALTRKADYSGPVNFWKPDRAKAPWQPVLFEHHPGKRPTSGGIRFDPRGNLYVGVNDGKVKNLPPGYTKDPTYRRVTARIYKYAPTGSVKDGCLYPKAPAAPAKVYDVHYSPMPRAYKTPRFGVDGWGRIYYPSGVESRVGIIDNEGNRILSFGTWGNRDSMGGLKGDLVPTKDVPMACPNSVDATDDYIYVSDMNNVRLLRLVKTFAAEETAEVK